MSHRKVTGLAAVLTGLFLGAPARADGPADPLALVPDKAELIVKVERPGQLAQTLYQLDAVQDLQKIEAVRELYNSTNARRLYQVLGYFEDKLGHKRFELLDRLAGGGIVLAARFSGGPPAALLVLQAGDEQVLKNFVKLAVEIIDQELARQDLKGGLKRGTYRNIETFQLDKAHAALAGSALLVASDAKVLQAALDCHLNGGAGSVSKVGTLAAARKQLPANPHAWAWLNLEALRSIPGYREGLKALTLNPVFYFVVGPISDVAQRTPYLCAALHQQEKDFVVSVRMPAGRDGMSDKAKLFLPEKEQATLPLLAPADVQFSVSYYLDLARLWENKDKWLGANERKGLDELEQKSGIVLGGIKLGQLLKQAGVHHRFVAVQKSTGVYKQKAGTPIGAFGLVLDMRDPAFSKSMESILRAAGLLASTQFNLNMVEEKRPTGTVVSYRFPEGKDVRGDILKIRYNFSPAFTQSGDQLILSSTVELACELADLVAAERGRSGSPATSRFRVFAAGNAASIRNGQDQLRTQMILGQGLSPEQARDQVRALIALVERLGIVDSAVLYNNNEFRFDIRWQQGK